MAKSPNIEVCSCLETLHLREALRKIQIIASERTAGDLVDDLAQINNLADQALRLEPLVGDPSLGTKVPR